MRCSTRHDSCRGGLLRRTSPAQTPADGVVSGTQVRALRACLKRRGEHGAAVLETFLSMLLIMLVLFGALQIFQLALAQMMADYSAFRGARSLSVGFDEDWAIIESKVKAVPASGHIIIPGENHNNKYFVRSSLPLATEKILLTDYMEQDDRYKDLSYTMWNGRRAQYHTDYRCPNYGLPVIGGCSICHPSGTKLPEVTAGDPYNGASLMTHFNFHFNNYPLAVPFYRILTGQKNVNISAESELTNYSTRFLRN